MKAGEILKHSNFLNDDTLLMFAGNPFHRAEAPTLTAKFIYDLGPDIGTCSSI